ncbi:MAG: hypothetical protein PHI68_07445 [Candidatus Cloacimonetes bacterium]|nr:hypothetical protein [Candidatus Cloacimonadota bacterium]
MNKKIVSLIIAVLVIVLGYHIIRTKFFPKEINNEAIRTAIQDYLDDSMGPEDFGLEPNHKTWKIERFAILKLSKDSIEPDEQTAEVTFWGSYETSQDSQIPVPQNFKLSHRFLIKGKEGAVLKVNRIRD